MDVDGRSPTLSPERTTHELDETLSLLRSALERAAGLTRRAAQLASSSGPRDDENVHALRLKAMQLERERRALYELLADTERHRTKLIGCYVATYQLHSTLDPAEVQATLGEIATQVLGADSFALLVRTDKKEELRVALTQGEADSLLGVRQGSVYEGGDAMIDEAIAERQLVLEPTPGSAALAAIPLASQGTLVGVLVLLRLLEQRSPLGPDDRELLELIGVHAASALIASNAFAASARKQRTLQGLLELAKGR